MYSFDPGMCSFKPCCQGFHQAYLLRTWTRTGLYIICMAPSPQRNVAPIKETLHLWQDPPISWDCYIDQMWCFMQMDILQCLIFSNCSENFWNLQFKCLREKDVDNVMSLYFSKCSSRTSNLENYSTYRISGLLQIYWIRICTLTKFSDDLYSH